jgi:hypothetical protein
MKFKTRELELSKAFDEVFLRLFLIGSRVLQIVISIPIIGFVAAVISGFSNAEIDVPSKATGALAVACVCTVYAGVTMLPVFFEGPMFFTMIAALDALFLAGWATLVGVWDCSATGSCRAFIAEYFDSLPERPSFTTDCKLTKAMFAFMIVNVYAALVGFLIYSNIAFRVLFGATALISFCLRTIELEHATHWKSLPLFRETRNAKATEHHCSCCNHTKEHPSPRSSFSGDRLRPEV